MKPDTKGGRVGPPATLPSVLGYVAQWCGLDPDFDRADDVQYVIDRWSIQQRQAHQND